MTVEKIYKIQYSGRRDKIVEGPLSYLNEYYGINCKSIKALINKVQRRYNEREAACYNRTFVTLIEA